MTSFNKFMGYCIFIGACCITQLVIYYTPEPDHNSILEHRRRLFELVHGTEEEAAAAIAAEEKKKKLQAQKTEV